MSKRIIGLIVACALALFGGATLAQPAAAVPQTSVANKAQEKAQAAKARAAKAQAAKAKAAKAKAVAAAKARAAAVAKARAKAAAKAKKAAEARMRELALSGPRAVALSKAATVARVRANAAARTAAQARTQAIVAARAANVARARSIAISKSKVSGKIKKQAAASAKAAAKSAAKAKARARSTAVAAVKARALVTTKLKQAAAARVDYAAQAGPRATAAAKAVVVARARSKAAAAAATRAQSAAVLAARSAAVLQAKAVSIAKSTASAKQKAKAAKQAKAAAKAAASARLQAQKKAADKAKAKAAVKLKVLAAARAKAAAGPNPLWAPKDGLVLNNPRGTRKQKLAIIAQINKGIDATPAGGQIRMAMYLFDIGSVAKKLTAATKRGVSVQILIDDGAANKYIRQVKKAAGKNKKARSFVATCDHGCMSDGASAIHAKFYLFSVAGKARYVSMISSANPYTGNTFKSWNNNHTIVGNKVIYDSLSKYFTDMLADKENLNYYRITSSGKYTMYLYPQQIRRPQDVVLLNVLNHTSCKTTAKGYGSNGRTLIRVDNWGWTGSRLDIAKRVWQLHNSGCKVQVLLNKGRTSRSVLKVLLKSSKKYGKLPVYNAWYDANNNGVASLYTHHKTLTINGMISGNNVKVTWTGSQNFTSLGTISNNDMILRVVDAKVTDDYNKNFAYIRDHYARRMYSVPRVARLVPEN
ncbi:MAG: phospholipase D-like domain-containing protein [Propionibacteriaceae bacterium]